ncbi:MAG TPA: hypothetical protein DCE78_07775 [Bacteroidetes bacterium]|nr:hypothetical protein [Bacteroidota bacterium]
MVKIENEDLKVDTRIKGVELLNCSINLPANPNAPITDFNFNISIESRADADNKLLFVIVHVEIRNENQSAVLGTLSVSCIYEIMNFHDVIKTEADGRIHIPLPLIDTLNSISISTTRGIMFSTFKGTFLHGAVLPIIDPRQLQTASQ